MAAPGEPINVADYERLAAEALDPGAHGYFAGGAGDERTLRENVAAFARWRLRPRVLVDVSEVTTSTTVLGEPVAMPILVAPVAFQRLAHPDGEAGMARAAASAGTVMCLSTLATARPGEVASCGARRAALVSALLLPRSGGDQGAALRGGRGRGSGPWR